MKIYTKTGDAGETSLFGGQRVPKDALRIEAYGTVDELNTLLGVCRAANPPSEISTLLVKIQHDLFTLGADLATPLDAAAKAIRRIQNEEIKEIEDEIDRIDPLLEPLREFIIPGGTMVAAQLHQARAVCRRAERLAVKLSQKEPLSRGVVVYLNRLSDYLFILARWANALSKTAEQKWNQR